MNGRKLPIEWTNLAKAGSNVVLLNLGKVPIAVRGRRDLPAGARLVLSELRDDLIARAVGEPCDYLVTVTPGLPRDL